ncbi:acyl carrier protein [Nocardia goodfellowii]
MDTNKAKIREFLSRYISVGEVTDDEDLFTRGHINSLLMVQLVLFVEKELATPVEDDDLDIDNFRSIEAIATFVGAKAGQALSA